MVSIVGPSGAGKSTLLHILGSLDTADQGSLTIDGVNPTKLNDSQLSAFRNKTMGFVFQFHQLLPEFTAIENICIPAFIGGRNSVEAEKDAMKWLSYLGLEERAHHRPSELSGGEQQRVSLGRALINNPSILFADEPSGNLDEANAAELHKLLVNLKQEFGKTIVLVTHNRELALLANRQITMIKGSITEDTLHSV